MAKAVTGGVCLDGAQTHGASINPPPFILDGRYGRKGRQYARLTKEDKIDILFRRCRKAERVLDSLRREL
jgi:hypothetical protein